MLPLFVGSETTTASLVTPEYILVLLYPLLFIRRTLEKEAVELLTYVPAGKFAGLGNITTKLVAFKLKSLKNQMLFNGSLTAR